MRVAAEIDATSTVSPTTEAEIRRLYGSERERLLRLAAMLLGDRESAEDIVQEAFMALHRRWATLTDQAAAPAYLSASVVNGARSVLRHRRVAIRHLRVGEPQGGPAADATALLADEHRSVVAAVRRLPRRQREVVVLRYWSELSETQIAATLGISAGTVKSNAARGLAKLQKELTTDER